MSKISVLKAFDAYPPAYFRNGDEIDDANLANRTVYEKGYDQALQDFLKRACDWLQKEVVDNYIGIIWDDCIQDFKNYMQNEI